jgi:hypothetical protein
VWNYARRLLLTVLANKSCVAKPTSILPVSVAWRVLTKVLANATCVSKMGAMGNLGFLVATLFAVVRSLFWFDIYSRWRLS